MVEGADPWCNPKPGAPIPISPSAGAVVEVLLSDVVPALDEGGADPVALLLLEVVAALSAAEFTALVGRGPGSKAGGSIAFPDVG